MNGTELQFPSLKSLLHCFWWFCVCVCVFQFEGLPTYPDVSRMWEIVDKYHVTKFYTAPTAIRLLMKYGSEPVQKWVVSEHHKMTSSDFYSRTKAAFNATGRWRSPSSRLRRYKRESLKVLGTVGEPINPEAWQWYYTVVGEKRCPIVDTFWQTETVS